MSGDPLVSCVMATRNRRHFLAQALRCFRRRNYANAELIVVDDSCRSAEKLCREVPGVRYLKLSCPTATGSKLNVAVEAANGRIIQKLDDDDYYAPEFLGTSVARLPKRPSRPTVVTRCCFLILRRNDPVVRFSGHGWKPGGALCFHREMWEKTPFRDTRLSEDSHFLRDHDPRILFICEPEQYMVVRHGRNTWTDINANGVRQTVDHFFKSRPQYDKRLSRLMPRLDAQFYRSLLLPTSV
jgi:glycosyltransferase involved in cell wall biosynthesis